MSTVEATALRLIGTPFRLHGRDPAHGLDCVGVVAAALAGGGCAASVPTGYQLRGGDQDRVAALLDAVGRQVKSAQPGDVLLMRTGPGQLHLGVWTTAGLVHADAGLRRVVLRPGAVAWPVLGMWRVGEG